MTDTVKKKKKVTIHGTVCTHLKTCCIWLRRSNCIKKKNQRETRVEYQTPTKKKNVTFKNNEQFCITVTRSGKKKQNKTSALACLLERRNVKSHTNSFVAIFIFQIELALFFFISAKCPKELKL